MSINNRMNVLLLTPDRVGSTLLQRVLTIYMLRQGFDKPVINLHELTNGLEKYINPTLNQEVLGKPRGTDWGYYQSLEEITELLKSADHYKTSRLAHYHIVARKDTIADQIKFYEYLNKDFYIISCRRKNLFEHVLSWVIHAHSKNLNVYSFDQKFDVFNEIYKNKITASKEQIFNKLNAYKKYIEWSDTYFNVQSYFNYEDSINDLENYILNLDFMNNTPTNTWNEMFGIEFDDWNKTHKLLPDTLLEPSQQEQEKINLVTIPISKNKWENIRGKDWPEKIPFNLEEYNKFPVAIREEIEHRIGYKTDYCITTTQEKSNFLQKTLSVYNDTHHQIAELVDNGFLVTGIPIKLQTFQEKKKLIKNYDQCIEWYNQWVQETNFGEIYSESQFQEQIELEELKMNNFSNLLTNVRD
jgi:hypothetical protein